ncbi:hypothetical protein [Streptosporangium oxazolinicum]|uniref:hypothetical protein n=1 Tax=Streptosporangium oxazolinicum TaxID=909287 RepID=UPI0031E68CD3
MAAILAWAAAAAAWKAAIASSEAGGAAGSLASAGVAEPVRLGPAGPAVLPEGVAGPIPPPCVRPRGTAEPVAAPGTAVPGG